MNQYMRRILISLVLCVVVAGCSEAKKTMDITVGIRGHQYQIPAKYILPELPSAMVPRGKGMDEDNGINLEIPLQDLDITPLHHEVPTGNADIVYVLLYGPAAFRSMNIYELNGEAYSAWMGDGNYKNRVIVRDEKTELYRIYWRKGGLSWVYFVEPPSIEQKQLPRWVANCRVWGGANSKEAGDMSNVDCTTQFSIAQGDVDISFTGRYVAQIDEILESVKKKILEWSIDPARDLRTPR